MNEKFGPRESRCMLLCLWRKKNLVRRFYWFMTLQDDDVEDFIFNIRMGAVSSTTTSKKKFMSIEQWTGAFNIFSLVYRLKYPSVVEGLSSYMGLIRQTADKQSSWYCHDTNFHGLKKSMNLAWSDTEHELFIIAMTKKQQLFRSSREHDPNKRANTRSNKTRNHKICDKFNKGANCGECSFPHICAFCGKPNHPQFKCWSRNRTDGPFEDQPTPDLLEMNPSLQNQIKQPQRLPVSDLPTHGNWSKFQLWFKG